MGRVGRSASTKNNTVLRQAVFKQWLYVTQNWPGLLADNEPTCQTVGVTVCLLHAHAANVTIRTSPHSLTKLRLASPVVQAHQPCCPSSRQDTAAVHGIGSFGQIGTCRGPPSPEPPSPAAAASAEQECQRQRQWRRQQRRRWQQHHILRQHHILGSELTEWKHTVCWGTNSIKAAMVSDLMDVSCMPLSCSQATCSCSYPCQSHVHVHGYSYLPCLAYVVHTAGWRASCL